MVRNTRSCSRMIVAAGLCLWVAGGILTGSAYGQATNQITAVSPTSAAQGTSGLLVTFTLSTGVPPAPPAGITPTNVTIGTIGGSSVTHSSQYTVTAVFNIPSGQSAGAIDASITFPTPNGTITFSKAGGFTVTAAAATPPSITQQPQSATVAPGGSATFTVAASGSPTLSYQWQRDTSDISGATSASYTIGSVTTNDAGSYRCVVTNSYGSATSNAATLTVSSGTTAWRFAVVADTHVTSNPTILPEIASAALADGVKFVLFPGDIVDAGTGTSSAQMQNQLNNWLAAVAPLYAAGVGVYPLRGNHENDATDSITAWNSVFTGSYALPANGPSGETNLTYSFTYANVLFIGLDEYVNIHRVNQAWLDAQLAGNTRPHVFVFGHEPAFQVFHTDCLGSYPTERNTFWSSLAGANAKVYFCGHDHFFDLARIDNGDGNTGNDLYQCVVGTGGSSHFMTYNGYRGDNGTYTPTGLFHEDPYGYLLVEVSGPGAYDLQVTMTFKQRTYDAGTASYTYVATADTLTYTAPSKAVSYPVVDTGQVKCYDASAEITAPAAGQAFYGQDAQFNGRQPGYTLSADGLTVYDNVTGLTWMQSPDTNLDGTITYSDKLTWTQAKAFPATVNTAHYGGYTDWRLPSIKELYSLIDFNGTDAGNGTDSSVLTPFIDTSYFAFTYGFTANGERIIDSQWATTTGYVANATMMFGVNFADGRIKGYGTSMPGGTDKVFHVLCVRGNTSYGVNDFVNNGDGTVTDNATGLMWSQADSGSGMNWQDALAWVQTKNTQNYLGHSDWRLPNAKELQSILDYSRSPDTTGSAAIDPVFLCTQITNENYQADYPWYWTGTTHAVYGHGGGEAAYVCFGRALGYMNGSWVDVHGAGAQRSDPKSGSLSSYSHAGNGYYSSLAPQGDAIRIFNYVRLVRDATTARVPGDIDGDGHVNLADLKLLVAAWNSAPGGATWKPAADLNGDNAINLGDLKILVAHWNQ